MKILLSIVLVLLPVLAPLQAQDPVTISPQNYKVLLENDEVRVLDYHLKPGEKEPMHSHPAGIVYVVNGGTMKFTFPDGRTEESTAKSGEAIARRPVTHACENTGNTEAHAIAIDLKKAAAPAEAKTSPASGSDETRVVEALKTMFVALANDDFPKFRSVVTPDFYAYDGGERFTAEMLTEEIKKAHAAGKKFVWKVTLPEVHVEGASAWITCMNDGSVGDASGMKPMRWRESAVLVKKDGQWRLRFFHSTRVP